MRFPATVSWIEDTWVAECPLLPGCLGDGATKEEALQSLVESISDFLTPDVDRWRSIEAGRVVVEIDVPLEITSSVR